MIKPYVEVIVERGADWKPKKIEHDDDSVLVKIKPIHFKHDEVLYVPVFQKNFKSILVRYGTIY